MEKLEKFPSQDFIVQTHRKMVFMAQIKESEEECNKKDLKSA